MLRARQLARRFSRALSIDRRLSLPDEFVRQSSHDLRELAVSSKSPRRTHLLASTLRHSLSPDAHCFAQSVGQPGGNQVLAKPERAGNPLACERVARHGEASSEKELGRSLEG